MLTFEQKLQIIQSYPQLERRDVSLGRVNFHYDQSVYDKTTIVYHLHPNGNGYVYAGMLKGYEVDAKGFVNIREYSENELRQVLEKSIQSLTGNVQTETASAKTDLPSSPKASQPKLGGNPGGIWRNASGETLLLKYEDDLWYIFTTPGMSLEMVFETRDEAGEYLADEGFKPQK